MIPIKTELKFLFLAMLIVVLIMPMSGCCTFCSNTPVATPRAPTATPGTPAAPSGEQMWYNGNVYSITGVAKNPTVVEFNSSVTITYIETYHWNGGSGVTPGTIALKGADGTMYGPWQASGMKGQGGVNNAYWIVEPDVTIKAGSYTVIDSDPSSWSTNSGMGYSGQTRIRYTPAAATVAPPAELTWDNGNVYAITGSSKSPAIVTFSKPVTVTYIHTYHWNGARGVTPGTIALKGADGTMYGPWQATGSDGQGGVKNAYWLVRPNVALKAGSYTIVDSDPSTFATNSQANGVGMAHVKYTITA